MFQNKFPQKIESGRPEIELPKMEKPEKIANSAGGLTEWKPNEDSIKKRWNILGKSRKKFREIERVRRQMSPNRFLESYTLRPEKRAIRKRKARINRATAGKPNLI